MFKRMITILVTMILLITVFPPYYVATVKPSNDAKLFVWEQAPDYYSKEHQSHISEVNRLVDAYMLAKSKNITIKSAGGKLLSVPLYQQETNFWCGPASGQMMLSFVTGTLHTQTYLAGLMETTQASGTFVWKLRRTLNQEIGSSAYQEVGTWQATFGNDLVYSIDNNKPIVCHVNTRKLPNYATLPPGNPGSGHYVVAIGYQWGTQGLTGFSNVNYHDPHNSSLHFGTYTTSVSNMVLAINDNAGFYIRATR
ncbi:MAG: Uncharacterized protein FD169_2472 [Bacillota bacterium]|nr:MAG: Uncharacterized protein FD169_2472 [Bacillota bacterium]